MAKHMGTQEQREMLVLQMAQAMKNQTPDAAARAAHVITFYTTGDYAELQRLRQLGFNECKRLGVFQ